MLLRSIRWFGSLAIAWSLATPLALAAGEKGPCVRQVAFSPDGRYLLGSAGKPEDQGVISLWEVANRRLLWTRREEKGIASLTFSPDSRSIAIGTFGPEAKVFDIKSTMLQARIRGLGKSTRAVAFSPDGKSLAVGSDGQPIRIWDVRGRTPLVTLPGNWDQIYSVAFSRDGERLVSTGAEGVKLWDTTTGKQIHAWRPKGSLARSAAFSPDGQWVVSGGSDGIARFWNVVGGELRAQFQTLGEIDSFSLSPADHILAIGGDSTSIQMFDCSQLRAEIFAPLKARFAGHSGRVEAVAFSPDGKTLASGGEDGTVRLWDLTNQTETARLIPGGDPALTAIYALAVATDGRVIAGGYGDGTIRIWEATTLKELKAWKGHGAGFLSLVFSTDGKTMFSSSFDHTVRAWNWVDGKEIRQFPWPEGNALSLSFSPDSKILAGAGGRLEAYAKDRAIHLWNSDTGQEVGQLLGHHQMILAIAFSPDGKTLASTSADRTVRLWDTTSMQEIRRLGPYANWAGLLAFSPDGETVLTGIEYNPLNFWNVRTGNEIAQLKDNPPPMAPIVFSPDGGTVAYVNAERNIGLWDVDSGRPIRQIVHPGGVKSFAFTPDGQKLISGGADIRVWNLFQRAFPAAHSPEDMERLWSDLAADDPGKAFEAVGMLAADPAQAVVFLNKQLQTIPAVDDKKLAQWVIDLDSDQPEIREKAFQGLERVGRCAEAILRKALVDQPSAEVKIQANALLKNIDGLVLRAGNLRDVRAVRVLERINSPKAREILRKLAKGEPQARLTVVAKNSLTRLEKDFSAPRAAVEPKQKPRTGSPPSLVPRLLDDPFQPGVLLSRLGSPRWITDTPVHYVAFGPDESMVSAGGEIFVWHRDTGQQLNRFGRYEKGLSAFSLSRTGKLLACAAHAPAIHIWNPATGKQLQQMQTGHHEVRCLAFSPDETMMVSAGDADGIELWNAADGRLIRRLAGHTSGCTSVVFSPDGKNIASGGGDHLVRVWDVTTGKELRELGDYLGQRDAIAISPDGNLLATEVAGYQIEIREYASGKVIRKITQGNSHVLGLHFSPTGKALAALFDKWNTIIGWNLESGKTTILCHQYSLVNSFSFSRGGLLLATAASDHSVRIFDATRWREIPLKRAHTAPITAVTFSSDDLTVTTAGRFTPNRKWDVPTGMELARPLQTPYRHNAVVFSADGRLGASIREGGGAHLWDVASGKELFPIDKPGESMHGLAFHPDSKKLVTAPWNEIRFWDLSTGKQLSSNSPMGGPLGGPPSTMVFLPDGKRVIWPNNSQGLVLRDPFTGKEAEWLDKRQFPYRPVAFSPNGKTLITSAEGVGVWELATLRERCMVTHENRPFQAGCLAVSPDGRMLATSEININLWDLATGKEIGRLVGHTFGVTSLAFSHDGRRLVSGSDQHECLVWDLNAMVRVQETAAPPPSNQDWEDLWEELTNSDSPRAFKALGRMVACSDLTVAFLRKKLQPAAAVVPPRISQLVQDLDSEEFAVREKAALELEQLGDWVKPDLRAVLQNSPSSELRAKINQLLEKPPRVTVPPEHLRESRALEILEFVGTTEAKQALAALGQGAPGAKLTEEAKGALERLSKRTSER